MVEGGRGHEADVKRKKETSLPYALKLDLADSQKTRKVNKSATNVV